MGTKKGMVRKTARRAYTKKAKSGSIASMAKRAGQFGKKKSGKYLNQDAKKGKKVKKARNSARMNRLEELGRIDAEKKNKNRCAVCAAAWSSRRLKAFVCFSLFFWNSRSI